MKNKTLPDPAAHTPIWSSLSLSLCVCVCVCACVSPMPFILRVPLDPAEAGPQQKPLMLRSQCMIYHLRESCGFHSNFLPGPPVFFLLLNCRGKKTKMQKKAEVTLKHPEQLLRFVHPVAKLLRRLCAVCLQRSHSHQLQWQ